MQKVVRGADLEGKYYALDLFSKKNTEKHSRTNLQLNNFAVITMIRLDFKTYNQPYKPIHTKI